MSNTIENSMFCAMVVLRKDEIKARMQKLKHCFDPPHQMDDSRSAQIPRRLCWGPDGLVPGDADEHAHFGEHDYIELLTLVLTSLLTVKKTAIMRLA